MITASIPTIVSKMGFYLGAHTFNWMGFAYLAFSAFSELLKRDHLNVIGFCIASTVIGGVHALGIFGLFGRVISDRNALRNSRYVLHESHHLPFYFHWGLGTIMKGMLMTFFWTFNAQHKTASFNDHRWSQEITAENTLMYLQWTGGMVLTVVFFLIHTVNLHTVFNRLTHPRVGHKTVNESMPLTRSY